METKINAKRVFFLTLVTANMSSALMALDKVEASTDVDIVSSYIWRKASCGGVSFQPNLSIDYKGLSLSTRGSVGINHEVGVIPWKGTYADKFNVTKLTLAAAKEVPITSNFSLPLFTQVTFNPYTSYSD